MSNSPLATYRNVTKNKNSPRNHKIDTITIHCMAGQMSGKNCADYFATTGRQVSANYCVGYDGDIAVSVDEKDRSWCSCSPSNDHRAITIEVATDSTYPYKCTDKAYKALLDLVTDVCKRNGIDALNYTGNTNGNMTKHKWFASTACPGAYLESKFAEIEKAVNLRLKTGAMIEETTQKTDQLYRVQIGSYITRKNAQAMADKAVAAGFYTVIREVKILLKTYYRVQIGAFANKANAEAYAEKARRAGFEAAVIS